MDPSRKSVVTAARTIALAEELGIARCVAIGNKANLPGDTLFFEQQCAELGVPLVGVIPMEVAVTTADRAGERVNEFTAPLLWEQINRLVTLIDERVSA